MTLWKLLTTNVTLVSDHEPINRVYYLGGYYVYGALASALIGAAAIAWHDRWALSLIFICALNNVVAYRTMFKYQQECPLMVYIGWSAPFLAAVKLIFYP